MTCEERLRAVLPGALRRWRSTDDGGQEACARILAPHLEHAWGLGWTSAKIVEVLDPVDRVDGAAMVHWTDEWSGA